MALLMANPNYGCVFGYLLDDRELAREWLSMIVGRKIAQLETSSFGANPDLKRNALGLFGASFTATVETDARAPQRVWLQVWKATQRADLMQLLLYLADKFPQYEPYKPSDAVALLPIVTIYFLGFKLATGYPAVFKMDHQVTDVLTGEVLLSRPREPFVELLNHESYTIQIPLLRETARTRLEQVLLLFNQEHRTEDPHKLSYAGEVSDPLVKKMVERLTRAIADEDLRRRMDVEDEVDHTIAKLLRGKDAIIEEKDVALREQKADLQEKDAALQESREELARRDALIADLMKRLEDGNNDS